MLRGLAAAAILGSSCSSGEVVFIDGFPESTASSALLAIHHDGAVEVQVHALPLTEPIEPRLLLSDESSWLELLFYEEPAVALFGGEGPLLAGVGTDALPATSEIFTLGLFDENVEWRRIERRSNELDAFTYDDPRADPCAELNVEVIALQHQEPVAELLLDEQGVLYAVVENEPGLFRIEDGISDPIEIDPPIGAVSASFHEGRLWIVTSSGAVWAGAIEGDRLALSLQPITAPGSTRWMIPNPFGEGLLALTREADLIELSSSETIHQLPIIDTTDEGVLAFLDGAVWVTTIKSDYVARWDGSSVVELPIPGGDLGGAVGFVPGIGILVGSLMGEIFRADGDALVPYVSTRLFDANAIVPFGDGFVVGSDVGALFRFSGGRTCQQFSSSVEDLELGVSYRGGAAFAPSSQKDRESAGGPTPVTLVRALIE